MMDRDIIESITSKEYAEIGNNIELRKELVEPQTVFTYGRNIWGWQI